MKFGLIEIEQNLKPFNFSFLLGYGNFGKLSKDYTIFFRDYVPYMNFFEEATADFKRLNYSMSSEGFSLGLSAGCFWEFGKFNSIKFKFVNQYYFVIDHASFQMVKYAGSDNVVTVNKTLTHKSFSFSFVLNHYVQVISRLGLYYGINLGYYFPIRNNNYNPSGVDVYMVGVEPTNFHIGLSYQIRKK